MKQTIQKITLFFGVFISLFLAATPAFASVNNFTISHFDADYYLSRDEEGRSVLRVIERITAEFPSHDQNKGLVREIPARYDGHSVSFSLESLMREGSPEPIYAQYKQKDFHVIETGTNEYVHNSQTYTFTYTLRDVTRYFANTDRDEWYWDINGTGWRVPIDRVSARLHIDEELIPMLTGDTACYRGAFGSTDRCTVVQEESGYYMSEEHFLQEENVTLAIGFQPNTFEPYQATLWEKIVSVWRTISFAAMLLVLPILFLLGITHYRLVQRTKEQRPVTPEYLPPQETSISLAARIRRLAYNVITAQLLDLAIRGYLKIYQVREKSFLQQADYDIEIARDVSDLAPEEQEVLRDIFTTSDLSNPTPGQRLRVSSMKNNRSISLRLTDNPTKLKALKLGQYALRTDAPMKESLIFSRWSLFFLIIGLPSFNFFLLFVSLIIFGMSKTLHPLTDKGLALVRHLNGLKYYISIAEAERIRVLQSPEAAARWRDFDSNFDPNDERKLLGLHEKLLPYAVLFGQEKQWVKHLGNLYEHQDASPSWYASSSSAFSAGSFMGSMQSFQSSINSSAAGSSSSGGSGGGGSSGGGGGGGGGGGR